MGIILAALLLPWSTATYGERLGLRVGVINPEDFNLIFTYGGFGTYEVTRYLDLELGVDYWDKSVEDTYDYDYGLEVRHVRSASDLSFCLYTKYMVPLKSDQVVFGAGAGFGAHFVNRRYLVTEQGWVIHDEKESEAHSGMHFLVEGGAPLSSVFGLSTRLRMGVVDDDFRLDLTTALSFKP